jgi:hypothetical protein
MTTRCFFQLGKHLEPEAYRVQIASQSNHSTPRRRWYKLHKAIVEYCMYSEAHVILEVLINEQTARVLSTWDLKGVKCFLEVAVPI